MFLLICVTHQRKDITAFPDKTIARHSYFINCISSQAMKTKRHVMLIQVLSIQLSLLFNSEIKEQDETIELSSQCCHLVVRKRIFTFSKSSFVRQAVKWFVL